MSETREVPPAEVPDEVAPEPAGNGLRGVLRRRLTETTTWTFLILLGIVAGFAALRFQQFATVFNFRNIAADASGLLIIAVGMTFVIITAGIDLSVGSVLVFSGVIAAKVMLAIGGESWGAIGAGLAAGLLAGLAATMNLLGKGDSLSTGVAGTIGFDAITVALLGRSRPLGTVLAGLLFGGLHAGGLAMQSIAQTPLTLTTVLQALIVLFVAAPALIHRIVPFVKARRAKIGPVPEGGLA